MRFFIIGIFVGVLTFLSSPAPVFASDVGCSPNEMCVCNGWGCKKYCIDNEGEWYCCVSGGIGCRCKNVSPEPLNSWQNYGLIDREGNVTNLDQFWKEFVENEPRFRMSSPAGEVLQPNFRDGAREHNALEFFGILGGQATIESYNLNTGAWEGVEILELPQ